MTLETASGLLFARSPFATALNDKSALLLQLFATILTIEKEA